MNDLWKFSGGQWTWVSGSATANDLGVYGTQLINSASNVPGSRWGPVGWTDAKGNLWLFGGWGYGSDATHGQGFLNDTWEYNVTAGQWTFKARRADAELHSIFGKLHVFGADARVLGFAIGDDFALMRAGERSDARVIRI